MKANTLIATLLLFATGISATGTAFTFYDEEEADGDIIGPEDYEPDGQDKDVCVDEGKEIYSVKFDDSFETYLKAADSLASEDTESPKYCIWAYKKEGCSGCLRFAYTYDWADFATDYLDFSEVGDEDSAISAKVTVGECPEDWDDDEC